MIGFVNAIPPNQHHNYLQPSKQFLQGWHIPGAIHGCIFVH